MLGSYAGVDQIAATALFLVGFTLMGAFFPSIRVNAIDLAPNFAGTLIAISSGLGSITGFVGPYVAGVLTPNVNFLNFYERFYILYRTLSFTL